MSKNEASNKSKDESRESQKEEQPQSVTALQSHVPAEIRNVSFPVSVRGYDRRAVDLYVRRVNRVIAELEVTRSPQAAVRHAVDRVSEQTKGILQQARESAEKITSAAREEADQIIGAAKAEAAELVVNASTDADRIGNDAEQVIAGARADAAEIAARSNAEADERRRQVEEEIAARQEEARARMHDLQADTEAVWKERQDLLDDMGGMAARLHEAAGAAAARFSRESQAEPAEETTDDSEAELDAQPTLVTPPATPKKARKS